MDCAKGRTHCAAKQAHQQDARLRIHRRPPLLIASHHGGHGSEVTLAAVITDDETRYKYPTTTLCLSCALRRTTRVYARSARLHYGQTGMDALTHAVEAFIGRSTTPYTRWRDGGSLSTTLFEACEHGDDMRANLLLAAYKAGVAFTRSYADMCSAIAHSLGGRYGIPHGLANAIILPHMLALMATPPPQAC
ncbi:MAG: iron-containing alcohol dehydrogenase [Collinsella sp.]